jgi:hypothetical protein
VRAVSAFSTAALSSLSVGRSPKNGSGNNDDTLHNNNKRARFWKFSLVTPRSCVSSAPKNPPTTPAPLEIDINVANKVASTPGGQSRAASTNTGMNDTYTQVTEFSSKSVLIKYILLNIPIKKLKTTITSIAPVNPETIHTNQNFMHVSLVHIFRYKNQ